VEQRHARAQHTITSGEERIARDAILAVSGEGLVHIESGSVLCVDSFPDGDWARIRYGDQTVSVFLIDLLQRTDRHA
jgi:hypothetical protein